MKLDLFANRISRVFFAGGVVRIEFCLIQPDEKGELSAEGPEEVNFTVTLPLTGYSRSVGELRKFTQDLQAKGILKQQDQSGDQQGGAGRPEGGNPGGGGPRGGGPRGGGPQGGRPQGGRPQHRQGKPDVGRRQRELTDLTSDNGNEPLV